MGSDTSTFIFGLGLGLLLGMASDYELKPTKLIPADLDNDGQRQELTGFYKNSKSAYFPDTNGIYRIAKDFDWNTASSNELERITAEATESIQTGIPGHPGYLIKEDVE